MKSFGEEHNEEMKSIYEEIRSSGQLTDEIEIYFEGIQIYESRHKNDLSLRQRQDLVRDQFLPKKQLLWLNAEEIEYLSERLDGVNHPIGIDILRKLNNGK